LGVESHADFVTTHAMGFDLVQGYLFNKPMGVKKFARARTLPASPSDQKP